MSKNNEFPKLRWPIQVQHLSSHGEQVIVLQCPLGVSQEPLVLRAAVIPLLQCFDGTKSIKNIEEIGVSPEVLSQLLTLLNAHLFLENTDYARALEIHKEEFNRATVRLSSSAGRVYPSEPLALRNEIGRYFPEVPGLLSDADTPVGIMSPHIDYRRGGKTYGYAYNSVKSFSYDTCILIGTSHQPSESLFILTDKDFACPLGTFEVNQNFSRHMNSLGGNRKFYTDEFLHKNEHSLDLQLPFLSLSQRRVKIVPILVGSFYRFLEQEKFPEEDSRYDEFVDAFAEAIRLEINNGQRVCLIAGVDMAHIGQEFGDSFLLDADKIEECRERDQKYLETILNSDRHALYTHVASDNDARRICGFPTMYTVLDAFQRADIFLRPELLHYDQAINTEKTSCVSFGAIKF